MSQEKPDLTAPLPPAPGSPTMQGTGGKSEDKRSISSLFWRGEKKEGARSRRGPTLCTSRVQLLSRALRGRQTGACRSLLRPRQGTGQPLRSEGHLDNRSPHKSMGLHRRNSSQAYGGANSHNQNKHRKKDGRDGRVWKEGWGRDLPHEKVFASST